MVEKIESKGHQYGENISVSNPSFTKEVPICEIPYQGSLFRKQLILPAFISGQSTSHAGHGPYESEEY